MKQHTPNTNQPSASPQCERSKAIQRKKGTAWIAALLAMASGLFASCEKEIEFNGEQTDPKLVLNCLVEPGQPVRAYLGKSYFFLDNDGTTTAPDDATASLYVNGNLVGALSRQTDTVCWDDIFYDDYGNPIPYYEFTTSFVNDYRPQQGDIIKIKASANGFDDVEAETSALPTLVACRVVEKKVFDWESTYSTWEDPYEETEDSVLYISYQMELIIEIADPNAGQTDFFRLLAESGSHYDDDMNYKSYYASYDDPIFTSGLGDNEFIDFSDLNLTPVGVFTDALFDGKSYQLKMPFSVSIMKKKDADLDFFRLPLKMQHLSKEYYNYLNTCNQGDMEFQIWAEPVQTYSNVTDGYGIVGGSTTDTLWVDLPLSE